MAIKVKATRRGYFGDRLIERGQVFEVEKVSQLSDSKRKRGGWMEVLECGAADKAAIEAARADADKRPVPAIQPPVVKPAADGKAADKK